MGKLFHGHSFEKGVFVTPMNQIENLYRTNWHKDTTPDYLWLALIINYYGRDNGLLYIRQIISFYKNEFGKMYEDLRLSTIMKMSLENKIKLYYYLRGILEKGVLDSLCLFLDILEEPVFNEFFNENIEYDERLNNVNDVMTKMYDFQSELSTDINYCVVLYNCIIGKMFVKKDMILCDAIQNYCKHNHSGEIMRLYESSIRATAQTFNAIKSCNDFSVMFWRKYSIMNDCKCIYKQYDTEQIDSKLIDYIRNILIYYNDYLMNVNPLDQKALVLFGILNYSFKLLCELSNGKLENSISGRIIIRVLLENYIITKYLLTEEKKHTNIWDEYQSYGSGKVKMLLERQKDDQNKDFTHIDYEYLSFIMNDGYNDAFLNMDTRYFDKKNIKEKFDSVDEKRKYNAYDYDSLFEHALWVQIRESALLKCTEQSHEYHWILDTDDVLQLSSVAKDVSSIILQHVELIDAIYSIPEEIRRMYEF